MSCNSLESIRSQCIPGSNTLLKDTYGLRHALHIQDDQIFLDQRSVLKMQTTDQILFVLDDGQEIVCSPEACWQAVAGEQAVPTVKEIGQLLAENLAYWSAYQRLHALVQTLSGVVEQLPMRLSLPQPRLDPFIEAALARCEPAPTLEKVMALAQVIDQPLPLVLDWLGQRGKTVRLSSSSTDAVEEEEPTPVTETLSAVSSSPSAKRSMFRWSTEMVAQLTGAFLAAPLDQSVSAIAKAIAECHGWPTESTEYKIYHLNLPDRREQKLQEQMKPEQEGDERYHSDGVTSAVRVGSSHDPREQEGVERAGLPEEQSGRQVGSVLSVDPVVLHRGNYVWDVQVDGALQRWYLDYPYGSFPGQPRGEVRYDNRAYTLQVVGTSTVRATSAQKVAFEEAVEVETLNVGGQR